MNKAFPTSIGSRAAYGAVFVLAALVGILSLALLGIRSGAGAEESRTVKTVELGLSANMPDPACPKMPCFVVAKVNGFQTRSPQSNSPFVTPFEGRITKFTLYLGKPNNKDRSALNNQFGSPPKAAIAVLRKIKTPKGEEKFKLVSKSPVEPLTQELGTKATFKLDSPLKVRKGSFISLAVPTWAPVFATGQDAESNRWRSSRQPGKCGAGSVSKSSPQLKVGSKRFYACKFRGERLLYTVTLSSR